jgi:excisionase family DNA binding protein
VKDGELLTTGHLARALGVTINTVKAWIRAGRLEAIRLPSGHHRIPRRELERLRGRRSADLPDRYRERLRQWEAADAWARARPVEERSIEDALAWVATMLDISAAHGTRVEPDIDETVERVRRLHDALARIHR